MISTVILATQLTFLQNKLFLMVLGKLKFRESNEIPGNQKQPFRGVLGKLCSENTQQIYRRTTPMPKCDFNNVALHCIFIEIILPHGCSPVNLQHIFRTPFPQNTSGRLLLRINYRLPEATIDTLESWTKPFKTEIIPVIRIVSPMKYSVQNCILLPRNQETYWKSWIHTKYFWYSNKKKFYRKQRLTDILLYGKSQSCKVQDSAELN